jgi:hypothetical protein
MTQTTEQVLKQQQDHADFQREQAAAGQSTTLDQPFDIDAEEGSRTLLPMGKYTAQIVNAVVAPLKSGRGMGVNLTWSISEGEYEKRLVFQNLNIQHDSADAERIGRGKFKDVCASLGLTGNITDLNTLLYKDCLITIVVRVDKTGNFPDRNEVSNVLPDPGRLGTPVNKKVSGTEQKAEVLKEASKTRPAFDATKENMNDEIPF